jgi:hypothetical protein
MFPHRIIKSEYYIGEGLHVDFVIYGPQKIGIEINGAQHYFFSTRFHKTYEDFERQQKRDERKAELAAEQGIALAWYDARDGVKKQELEQLVRSAFDIDVDHSKKEFRNTRKKPQSVIDFQQKVKERQRLRRKEQYQQMKQAKKMRGGGYGV